MNLAPCVAAVSVNKLLTLTAATQGARFKAQGAPSRGVGAPSRGAPLPPSSARWKVQTENS